MATTMDIKYGVSATFNSAKDIYDAAGKVREEGYQNWECYTPIPIHGLDAQMGVGRSKVPCFTLLGGVTGFFTGMLIVWFMNAYDYPLIVGGKPYFSPIYPFPVFYELTILFAAFGTLFGMFFLNRLPQHNHAVFEHPNFGKTGDDKFMIVIEIEDSKFDEEETPSFLKSLGGKSITTIKEKID
jgi:hypothetical protein